MMSLRILHASFLALRVSCLGDDAELQSTLGTDDASLDVHNFTSLFSDELHKVSSFVQRLRDEDEILEDAVAPRNSTLHMPSVVLGKYSKRTGIEHPMMNITGVVERQAARVDEHKRGADLTGQN